MSGSEEVSCSMKLEPMLRQGRLAKCFVNTLTDLSICSDNNVL
jgi:hypothetical protein